VAGIKPLGGDMTYHNKWRIKKESSGYGESYTLQKRMLGFLWWYNPDNIDGCITGVYDSLEEAKEEYRRKVTPTKAEFLDV
jgi:hypothetical protein